MQITFPSAFIYFMHSQVRDTLSFFYYIILINNFSGVGIPLQLFHRS